MTRATKRTTIILIYLAILASLFYAIYSIVKPAPTCFDGKKNQHEEGVDCGGPCDKCAIEIEAKDLEITETAFIYGGPGKFDTLAKVTNANNQFGSSSFSYEFILKDSSGNVVARKAGKSFILPSETKYIIETGLDSQIEVASVGFEITNTEWQEFINNDKPKINIYSKDYSQITSGVGYSQAYGLLRNENPFDFNLIKVKVVLRDVFNKPIAVNTTEMRTVKAGEERDFRLLWPTSFPGDVHSYEVEAEADVFNTENFIRVHIREKEPKVYD